MSDQRTSDRRTSNRTQKFGKKRMLEKLRLFFILSGTTFCIMMLLGLGSFLQAKWFTSPVHVMKGLSASLSSQFFVDMLSMEVQQLKKDDASFTFSHRNTANFLLRFIMNINPLDPKTLLASEIPGISNEKLVLFRPGLDAGAVPPRDYAPPRNTHEPVEPEDKEEDNGKAEGEEGALPELSVNFASLLDIVDNSRIPLLELGANTPGKPSAGDGRKKVFIYHTHTRESFLPELKEGLKFEEAYDAKINVTLLGERLAEKLNGMGIGALSSSSDYATEVQGYNWNYSYKYSLDTVKEAFAANPSLEYYFDIHRDAGTRDTTTVNINGQDYAQVFFVIGHKNPNWQKNEQLASKIHERLEQEYPGISRGVWGKQASSGNNGEYNQSFSPNSVLIEVGGVENTLEETYRTIDALANVIAEIVMDAEKVNQPVQEAKSAS